MDGLRELMARNAQPGQVEWVGLRAGRRAAMVAVDGAEVGLAGLAGDHGVAGKRAVTLIQAEHLAAIGAFLGRGPVRAADLRRNLVVSGINLAALKGRLVRVGGAVLQITGICAPCSRMEETLGAGGYSAVRGHGGWCAEVIEPGPVRRNDRVEAADGGGA